MTTLSLKDMEVLHVRPGDTLVVKARTRLTVEQAERLRTVLGGRVPAGCHVLVADPDVDLTVLRAEVAPAHGS